MEDKGPSLRVKEREGLRAEPGGMAEFKGELPLPGGGGGRKGGKGGGEALEGGEIEGEGGGELEEDGAAEGGREEGRAGEEEGEFVGESGGVEGAGVMLFCIWRGSGGRMC